MTVLRIAQRYEKQDLLGQGGMGQVYLALDSQSGQSVAVKSLKPEMAQDELIERFVREGEALHQLNHPNIVKMLEIVEEEGQHHLVMEYMGEYHRGDRLDPGSDSGAQGIGGGGK